MTFSTGNPVPSADFRDLSDNSEAMDSAMNSASPTFNDRLGVARVSYNGFQAAFNTNEAARQATFDAGEATRAAFTANLANNSDPAKGAALVGYSGTTVKAKLDGLTAASTPTFTAVAVQGVKFPAVQVPSADPNTLDDYEEGTWTPTFTFTSPGNLTVVYSSRLATYTKIGRQVLMDFDVQTSTFTHTTASGSARITGQPFNNATPLPEPIGRLAHGPITVSAGYNSIQPIAVATVPQLGFIASNPAGAASTLTFSNFPTGTQLVLKGSITCRVD